MMAGGRTRRQLLKAFMIFLFSSDKIITIMAKSSLNGRYELCVDLSIAYTFLIEFDRQRCAPKTMSIYIAYRWPIPNK